MLAQVAETPITIELNSGTPEQITLLGEKHDFSGVRDRLSYLSNTFGRHDPVLVFFDDKTSAETVISVFEMTKKTHDEVFLILQDSSPRDTSRLIIFKTLKDNKAIPPIKESDRRLDISGSINGNTIPSDPTELVRRARKALLDISTNK
ncbi:MAG: hypothetical protein ABI254_06415 [Chthoniobacterales bacterium]